MSVLPFIANFEEFWPSKPLRVLDQHFGLGLRDSDPLVPFTILQEINRLMRHPLLGYYPTRSGEEHSGSEICIDKNTFQVNLDVQHFNPDEITVKITGDNTITVEGKHEEKRDEHGYISRQFVRKYVLPKTPNIHEVQSKLSTDGMLTITAPKINTESIEQKTIPIQSC